MHRLERGIISVWIEVVRIYEFQLFALEGLFKAMTRAISVYMYWDIIEHSFMWWTKIIPSCDKKFFHHMKAIRFFNANIEMMYFWLVKTFYSYNNFNNRYCYNTASQKSIGSIWSQVSWLNWTTLATEPHRIISLDFLDLVYILL